MSNFGNVLYSLYTLTDEGDLDERIAEEYHMVGDSDEDALQRLLDQPYENEAGSGTVREFLYAENPLIAFCWQEITYAEPMIEGNAHRVIREVLEK